MASRRRKNIVEVESNHNLFEFSTRNESESDPVKTVRRILSVMVSESVDKEEKGLSGFSSADDKTIESWNLNHPWLIVLRTDTGIRLKCSVCSEAKVGSKGPEMVLVMRRKTVLPVILKAVNTTNFQQQHFM